MLGTARHQSRLRFVSSDPAGLGLVSKGLSSDSVRTVGSLARATNSVAPEDQLRVESHRRFTGGSSHRRSPVAHVMCCCRVDSVSGPHSDLMTPKRRPVAVVAAGMAVEGYDWVTFLTLLPYMTRELFDDDETGAGWATVCPTPLPLLRGVRRDDVSHNCGHCNHGRSSINWDTTVNSSTATIVTARQPVSCIDFRSGRTPEVSIPNGRVETAVAAWSFARRRVR